MASTSSEAHTVRLAARAALEKKAAGLVVLDLGASPASPTFSWLPARGRAHRSTPSPTPSRWRSRRPECGARHREGTAKSGWLLLDYGDVVVHVFADATREFYALERLWGDAPCSPSKAPEPAASPGCVPLGAMVATAPLSRDRPRYCQGFQGGGDEEERLAHFRRSWRRSIANSSRGREDVYSTPGSDDDSTKDLGDQALRAPSNPRVPVQLGNGDRRLLKEVVSALQKLDEGGFGSCERCEVVAEKRLEALPFARYCITCQRAVEEEERTAAG